MPAFFTLQVDQNVTEQQLIEGCKAQERKAQQMLYDRYSKAMHTLAYRITGNFEDAGEALQDAFLNVFKHIEQFEGRSTLGAWIKGIVARSALGKVRRRNPAFEAWEPSVQPERIDWNAVPLAAEYLEQAIRNLPDGYRSVFVLAAVEGYTHLEIADMLGISEGASKSQLFHAKKRLRDLLKGMAV